MATAAKVPHTTEQLISFGINIIQKTGDFERALMEWHKMDRNLRTWQNLKDHFSKAHRALRKIRGTIIKNTPFHQANQMAQSLHDDISDLRSGFRELMPILTSPTIDPPTPTTFAQTATMAPSANAATNQDLLQELVLQLQNQIQELSKNKESTKKLKPFVRNQTDKYCWTHGACGYEGKYCRNKKDGHKDEATFKNRMGGSNQFCKLLQDETNQGSN